MVSYMLLGASASFMGLTLALDLFGPRGGLLTHTGNGVLSHPEVCELEYRDVGG